MDTRIQTASRGFAALLAAGAVACGGGSAPTAPAPSPPATTPTPGTRRIPLTDMAGANYLGFASGLYPNGANTPPAAHAAEGLRRANAVRPLNVAGRPDAAGRYVLLSIGMSNTTQEFCSSERRPAFGNATLTTARTRSTARCCGSGLATEPRAASGPTRSSSSPDGRAEA